MPTENNAWIPEKEGDSIEGRIIEVIKGWSDARTNGGKDMDAGWYPLIRLQLDDGADRDVHCFSTVLENRVRDKRPLPGERVKITYLGVSRKEPPKGQNAPKLYRFEMPDRDPRADATSVYDDLYGARGPSSPPPAPVQAPDADPLPF